MKKRLVLILVLLIVATSFTFGKTKFTTLTIKSEKFIAEIADTPYLRAKGMMYRERMKENFAMLFTFEKPDYQGFWMKNTLIHLDIIYLNEDKEIVKIHHNVPPCKNEDCISYPSEKKAMYVVELKGGKAKKMGLKTGDRIEFLL